MAVLSSQDQGRAAAVARLWDSAPKEELKFLVASPENPWPKQYLCLLYVLDEAQRRGTGHIGFDDLVLRGTSLVEAFTGEHLDEATIERRIRQLDDWGLVERSAETNASIPLSRWRMSSQRHQLTKQGMLVVRLIEKAAATRERRSGAQDANLLLRELVASLREIRALVGPLQGPDRSSLRRDAYIKLQAAAGRHKAITDYLRDLHISLLNFGIKHENITSGLGAMLDRLDTYMAGVHREFRTQGHAVAAACSDLATGDCIEELRLGCALVRAKDEEDTFGDDVSRPSPDDLLAQMQSFFASDEPGSLSSEVDRVQATCSLIISRLRLHYQNLTERTQHLQMLQLSWQRLKDLDWEDRVGWDRALHWGHHILALRPIQTAPNMGTNEAPGRPPEPRQRRTLRPRMAVAVKAQLAPDVDFDEHHLDERVAQLTDLGRRILAGRGHASLSDFPVLSSHDEFRLLLELVFHCVTHSNLSRRLPFDIEFTAGVVSWKRGALSYLFPDARITPHIEVQHAR